MPSPPTMLFSALLVLAGVLHAVAISNTGLACPRPLPAGAGPSSALGSPPPVLHAHASAEEAAHLQQGSGTPNAAAYYQLPAGRAAHPAAAGQPRRGSFERAPSGRLSPMLPTGAAANHSHSRGSSGQPSPREPEASGASGSLALGGLLPRPSSPGPLPPPLLGRGQPPYRAGSLSYHGPAAGPPLRSSSSLLPGELLPQGSGLSLPERVSGGESAERLPWGWQHKSLTSQGSFRGFLWPR